jgi:hypothetical protein
VLDNAVMNLFTELERASDPRLHALFRIFEREALEGEGMLAAERTVIAEIENNPRFSDFYSIAQNPSQGRLSSIDLVAEIDHAVPFSITIPENTAFSLPVLSLEFDKDLVLDAFPHDEYWEFREEPSKFQHERIGDKKPTTTNQRWRLLTNYTGKYLDFIKERPLERFSQMVSASVYTASKKCEVRTVKTSNPTFNQPDYVIVLEDEPLIHIKLRRNKIIVQGSYTIANLGCWEWSLDVAKMALIALKSEYRVEANSPVYARHRR